MLMMTGGNLSEVRDALRRVEVGDVVGYAETGSLSAELVPTATPHWHVVETQPNHEKIVAAHLITRRFGIYVPESEEDIVRRGRKLHVTRLMFTGYVFVFCWDINRHWDRIVSVPGVSRIMTQTNANGRIQAKILSDRALDLIRVEENRKRPLPDLIVEDVTKPGKKAKRRRRKAKISHQQLRDNDIVSVRTWDAFRDGISSLDFSERNKALETALSLPSQQSLNEREVSGMVD